MDTRVVALRLETQARNLREIAANLCLNGTFPTACQTSIGNFLCSTSVLSYEGIIDDACDLEADARKLRSLFT